MHFTLVSESAVFNVIFAKMTFFLCFLALSGAFTLDIEIVHFEVIFIRCDFFELKIVVLNWAGLIFDITFNNAFLWIE